MMLTETISMEMMHRNNMTRDTQIGVPKDPQDATKGLIWKDVFSLTDNYFEAIEQYFKNKKKITGPDGR